MANKGKVLASRPITDTGKLQQLIKAVQEVHPVVADAFVVAMGTTLRMGDVLDLTVESCKWLDEDVIVLREQKTEKARRVLVHPKAKEVLKARLEKATGYLFEGQRGKPTVSYVNRVLKTAGEKIGLDRSDMKSHVARKSAARHMFEAGTPLPVIVNMLGHANERVTLNYCCITTEEQRAAINAIPL